MMNKPLQDLIGFMRKVDELKKEIVKIKLAIASSKQFKHKVDLNIKLKDKENELNSLLFES